MDFVQAVANLDESADLHSARLLVLLAAFHRDQPTPAIEGLTKLAKLDFLLRYPVALEHALKARRRSVRGVDIQDHERHSVESEMVRYRFGPWDHRYREILNRLIAKGLISIRLEGRTVVMTLTSAGLAVAKRLADDEAFALYVKRARMLKSEFDLTATTLMRFIYDTFPEILTLRSNAPIRT